VSEDPPNDAGIVDGGDEAHAAPTAGRALSVCLMSAWTNTLSDALKLDQDLEKFGMRGYF